MSSTVDNRIVKISMDNKDFEKKSSRTLQTLDKLDKALKFDKADEGFKKIENAAKDVKLDGIIAALNTIESKFTVTGRIVDQVIRTTTTKAINGVQSALGQITSGGMARALNIEQAMFQFKALGINAKKAMDSASYAVDGTAYGLDAAATVAAQFGASGVKAGNDMSEALRAVSGVAAMTGSSYEDIGNIFTSVAGNGRLMGDQLLQLSARGLNAAAVLAKSLGKTETEVRDMVSHGEISFELFYKAMDDAFGKHAKDANKTFTGAMSNVRAALSRLGQSFATSYIDNARIAAIKFIDVLNKLKEKLQPVYKSFDILAKYIRKQLVKAFKNIPWGFVTYQIKTVNKALKSIPGFLTPIINRVNHVFKVLRKYNLKSLRYILNAIGNSIKFIGKIINPIERGLRSNALPFISKEIASTSKRIYKFTRRLTISRESIRNLNKITKGAVSVFKILWKTVKGVAGIFSPLTPLLKKVGAGLLDIGGKIGSFITKADKAYDKNKKLNKIFQLLKASVGKIVEYIEVYTDAFKEAFRKSKNTEGVKRLQESFSKWKKVLDKVKTSLTDGIIGGLEKFSKKKVKAPKVDTMTKIIDKLAGKLATVLDFFDKINKFINKINKKTGLFDKLKKINIEPIQKGANKAINKINKGLTDLFGNLDKMTKSKESKKLGKNTKKMLNDISDGFKKFDIDTAIKRIGKIAKIGSLLLVSAGLFLFLERLSVFVKKGPPLFQQFGSVLEGISKVLDQEVQNMKADMFYTVSKGIAVLAASLVALAAVDVNQLDSAVSAIIAVLATIAILMVAMSKVMAAQAQASTFEKGVVGFLQRIASGVSKFITLTGVAGLVISIGAAFLMLANSIKALSTIPWDALQVGIVGLITAMGVLLLTYAALNKLTSENKIDPKSSLAIAAIGASIFLIAEGLSRLAEADPKNILQATISILGVLTALGIIINTSSKYVSALPAMAASFISFGLAVQLISNALILMAVIPYNALAKGAIVIWSVLGVMAFASRISRSMPRTAAGILAFAGAITILTGSIIALGLMAKVAWEGLKIFAAISGILVVAVAVFGAIATAMPAVTAALTSLAGLGGVILAISVGFFLFARSLKSLGEGLPVFINGFVAFSEVLLKNAPLIAKSVFFLVLLIGTSLLAAFALIKGQLIVQIVSTIFLLVMVLGKNLPVFLKKLKVIVKRIVTFITGLVKILVPALLDLLIKTINLLAKAIVDKSGAIWKAIMNVIYALGYLILDGIYLLIEKILKLLSKIPVFGKKVKPALKTMQEFRKSNKEVANDEMGITDKQTKKNKKNADQTAKDIKNSGKKSEKATKRSAGSITDTLKKAGTNIFKNSKSNNNSVLNNLTGNDNIDKYFNAGKKMGTAQSDGYNKGLKNGTKKTKTKKNTKTSKKTTTPKVNNPDNRSTEEYNSYLLSPRNKKKTTKNKTKTKINTNKDLLLTKKQRELIKKDNKIILNNSQIKSLGLSYSNAKKYGKKLTKYRMSLTKDEIKRAKNNKSIKIRKVTWNSWIKTSNKNKEKMNSIDKERKRFNDRYIGKYSKVEGLSSISLDKKQIKLIKKKHKNYVKLTEAQRKNLKLGYNKDLKIGLNYRIKLNKEQIKSIKNGKKLVFTNKQAKNLDKLSKKNKQAIKDAKQRQATLNKLYKTQRKARKEENTRKDMKLLGDLDKTPVISPVLSTDNLNKNLLTALKDTASASGIVMDNGKIKLSISDKSLNSLDVFSNLLAESLSANNNLMTSLDDKLNYLKVIAGNTDGITNDIYLDGKTLVGYMDDSLGNTILNAVRG